MTDYKIGKKLYWMYAIYIGALPVLSVLGISEILENYKIEVFKISGDIYMLLWLISIIITGLIIRAPYEKIMYEKYKWEFDGEELRSSYKNTVIKNNEIVSIYKEIVESTNRSKISSLFLNKDYYNSILNKTLVLRLTNDRYIFFQFETLENGQSLQEKILTANATKIALESFDLTKNENKGLKKSWYKIQEISFVI